MSASNAFETDILNHVFVNSAISAIGDASGLQPAATTGNLYVSLHTADPGEAGVQNTNEASYTGYGRVAVARTSGGWTVSGNQVQNTAAISFGQNTGSSQTVTHFGVGAESTGATKLLFSGALTSSLTVDNGVTPEFNAGSLTITAD